jgi:hypothetical protein
MPRLYYAGVRSALKDLALCFECIVNHRSDSCGAKTIFSLASRARCAVPRCATTHSDLAFDTIHRKIIEKTCVVSGRSVTELYRHMMAHESQSYSYYANADAVMSWTEGLGKHQSQEQRLPLGWIQGMLEAAPSQRLSSETLCIHIASASRDPTISLSFTGRCFTEEEESEEEVWSSEDGDVSGRRRSIATTKARSRVSQVSGGPRAPTIRRHTHQPSHSMKKQGMIG